MSINNGAQRNPSPLAEHWQNPASANCTPTRKARPQGAPRSHVAYWKGALQTCPRTGNYFVRIFHSGRRARFTFGRNAEAAAERARLIFTTLEKLGWRDTLAKYSPRGAARTEREEAEAAARAHETALGGRIATPTVGDVIRVAGELSTTRPATLHGYAKSLRFLVSEICAVPHTEEAPARPSKQRKAGKARMRIKDIRKDYRSGGLAKWREVVDSVPLAKLTPGDVQRLRVEYLARAGTDPRAEDSARVTFNRQLRNAKALFSKKLLPFLREKLVLPSPLFFEGVAFEKCAPRRYVSKIDPATILRAGMETFSASNPEVAKALFLCLVLGLRRREADALTWRAVDFERREVNIAPTEHYALKSADSARVIALDDTALALFRGWHAKKGASEFVLESRFAPKPGALNPEYRARETWATLTEWLRAQGITARKAIHELRKECGTLLLKSGAPIESVSRYLGHSEIGITLKIYADQTKQRVSVDTGALLGAANVAQFPPPPAGPIKRAKTTKRRRA